MQSQWKSKVGWCVMIWGADKLHILKLQLEKHPVLFKLNNLCYVLTKMPRIWVHVFRFWQEISFFFLAKKSQAYRTLVCAFLLFGVLILGHPSTLSAQISFTKSWNCRGRKKMWKNSSFSDVYWRFWTLLMISQSSASLFVMEIKKFYNHCFLQLILSFMKKYRQV